MKTVDSMLAFCPDFAFVLSYNALCYGKPKAEAARLAARFVSPVKF